MAQFDEAIKWRKTSPAPVLHQRWDFLLQVIMQCLGAFPDLRRAAKAVSRKRRGCYGRLPLPDNSGSICLPTRIIPNGESTDMHLVARNPTRVTDRIERLAVCGMDPFGLLSKKVFPTSDFRGSVATGMVGANRTR